MLKNSTVENTSQIFCLFCPAPAVAFCQAKIGSLLPEEQFYLTVQLRLLREIKDYYLSNAIILYI